jgi:AraC-like DNA-binding protein
LEYVAAHIAGYGRRGDLGGYTPAWASFGGYGFEGNRRNYGGIMQSISESPSGAVQAIVQEVDDYERSVHGVEINAVRTGPGSTMTRVSAIVDDDTVSTSVVTGFPMLSRTTIPDDIVIAGVIRFAPSGARWCDIDLRSGDVLLFEPGAEHVGLNPEHSSFAFSAINTAAVMAASQDMHEPLRMPRSSQVRKLAASPNVGRLSAAIVSQFGLSPYRASETPRMSEMLAPAFVAALSGDNESTVRRRGTIDNGLVVTRCMELAETLQRRPTTHEMCRAAFVSERRLRIAFAAVVDMPPLRFFRMWALGVAHRRFLDRSSRRRPVADVAISLGFYNLGRFARDYSRQHGELPSQSLHRTQHIHDLRVAP